MWLWLLTAFCACIQISKLDNGTRSPPLAEAQSYFNDTHVSGDQKEFTHNINDEMHFCGFPIYFYSVACSNSSSCPPSEPNVSTLHTSSSLPFFSKHPLPLLTERNT